MKGNQTRKEEVKLSQFLYDMILYRGEHKDLIRTLLKLTGEFGKVTGYKLKEHKSMVLVYTNNSRDEKK